MSAHVEEHFAGSNKLFTSIWAWLIGLTLIEIFLAYRPMPIRYMLTILMGLSIVKAALIIGFFMHLKYEVSRMKWLTMSSLVVCLILMSIFFFPDAFRILYLGVK